MKWLKKVCDTKGIVNLAMSPVLLLSGTIANNWVLYPVVIVWIVSSLIEKLIRLEDLKTKKINNDNISTHNRLLNERESIENERRKIKNNLLQISNLSSACDQCEKPNERKLGSNSASSVKKMLKKELADNGNVHDGLN